MIAGLEEIDAVFLDKIYDAVFLGQPARPDTWSEIFEGFRLADSSKRISHDGFDQRDSAQGNSAVGLNPVLQVLNKFGLENSVTLFLSQGLPRDAACRWSWA